ncbi:MAG TPA: DnaT-like ssDNA-binding domain-containing protein [Porticoccaceae bacterium]
MSLLPERHLLVSPQLAATLGLEEALLYQLLAECQAICRGEIHRGEAWFSLDCQQLQTLLPFWSSQDIRRISHSLRDKGVLAIDSLPFGIDTEFRFAFTTGNPAGLARTERRAPERTPTRLLHPDWVPAPDVVAQLVQYGIPHDFIEQQIAEFVTYWSERREPRHSWNAKFLKHVLRLWREEEARSAQRGRETLMDPLWQPSPDAVRILVEQAGINRNFVEDAVPEFILYWRDRGERRSTWNSDFVRHVKRQWARFTASLEHDSDPCPLDSNWQPSNDLYEVLSLANIPREFALSELPAFVLFWRENGHATNSWNTKFLQHVKRQWARQATEGERNHERRQSSGAPVSTRHRSLVDDLSDRSWAD